jgi:hypothetical protein
VPPGTIRTRLTRARQALRERIADTGDAGAREDDGDPMTSSLVTSEADDKQSPNTGTASR